MEIYDSHTTYEWLVQVALSIVDPWGDDRADLRAAYNTMAAVGSDDQNVLDALVGYLEINKRHEVVGPAAMKQALEG